jgi:rsbT co-antagonist protein RsbR
MTTDISTILQKKKQQILEAWINGQLANEILRDDLISNDESRNESEELLNAFLGRLVAQKNGVAPDNDFDPVLELLETLTLKRVIRRGKPAFFFSA